MSRHRTGDRHGGDPSATARRLGLQSIPPIYLDFSANLNPLGPPDALYNQILRHMGDLEHYPQPTAHDATAELAVAHGVTEDSVIIGNGSTELLSWIVQTLKPNQPAAPAPSYSGYKEVCSAAGLNLQYISDPPKDNSYTRYLSALENVNWDLAFIGRPNNPTGLTSDKQEIISLAEKYPNRWLVIDESFIDFLPNAGTETLITADTPRNIIVVKSLTKIFAIPGLRLGMAHSHPETINILRHAQLPWTVNALAQSAAKWLYTRNDYLDKTRTTVSALRESFQKQLNQLDGFRAHPSYANFFLLSLPDDWPAERLQKAMLKRGILIRTYGDNDPCLNSAICRLAVRPATEIEEFMSALKSILSPETDNTDRNPSSQTPAIMVVGTMSDSGKSIVAAGLCRFFARKGLSVAPFKAQNMSLNSFVTREGGEMGRAQVVQAEAALIEPHTDMNPVLLKPLGTAGSQVIMNGQPVGNLTAQNYYEKKQRWIPAVREAYDRMKDKYDLIILEGAGSPAEINLMDEDFVNMAMAEYANAHVILVADIDRGGVFASIFGTIALIPERHRRLIRGVIINKFRGDPALLGSGIKQIEELTGIPVLGILPYLQNIEIDDEDSLALDAKSPSTDAVLDIVVVRLPHISNFTDFHPLERTPGVSIRYPLDHINVGSPDLVIIPGTKNTRSDTLFLHDSGWSDTLTQLSNAGTPIIGICGGYQILGTRISDPSGIEGQPGETVGLNLLALTTVLEPRKELAQVKGITSTSLPFAEPGTKFTGYEIHSGRTTAMSATPEPVIITTRRSETVNQPHGAVSDNGTVLGFYVHGFFDEPTIRHQLLTWLCARKNCDPPPWDNHASQNDPLDVLADSLEQHLDMHAIEMMAR